LSSIDGLQNRPGIDEFKHLGWKQHPLVATGHIIGISGNSLCIRVDISVDEAIALEGGEFNVKRLTADQVKALLIEGGLPLPEKLRPESGVT